jgi:hypothetical protein
MSGKTLIVLAVIGLCGYALTREARPAPPGASAADSAAYAQAGIGARFSYGLGKLGSKIVGGSVTDMVTANEQALKEMKGDIRKAKGGEGIRARKFAEKVALMDSTATVDLRLGRPVKAVRGAMEAKNLLNAVRQQLKDPF